MLFSSCFFLCLGFAELLGLGYFMKIVFMKFGKFLVIVSSDIFFCSPPFSGTPITCTLGHLNLSYRTDTLLSFSENSFSFSVSFWLILYCYVFKVLNLFFLQCLVCH